MAQRLLSILVSALLWSGVAHAQTPSFSSAEKRGPPSECRAGSFVDLRLDDWSVGAQCWSCPNGYIRTLDPVTSATACFKESSTDYEKAAFKHKWLCDGSKDEFLDLRKGGECWKCPSGKPRRTAYAVTSDKACATTHVFGESLGSATYVRKVKTCRDGSFLDPRKGGECWKCPSGYARTVHDVNGNRACVKDTPDSHASARLENQLGCPSGQFFDPRKGGECWKCPSTHRHRTMAAVTTDKACTNNPLGILPFDQASTCKDLIRALNRALEAGAKGSKALEDLTKPVIDPVAGILQQELSKMSDLVGDIEPLEALIAKADNDLFKRIGALSERFDDVAKIREALLRADTCTDSPREIEARLKSLFGRNTRRGEFFAVTLGLTFTHSVYRATAQLGLTVVTDFEGKGGLFVSGKIGATTSEDPFAIGISAMVFPDAKLTDFGLSAVPAITASVAKGNAFNQLFEKHPTLLAATRVIDGIDISWSPASPNKIPTFGVAKSLFTKEGSIPRLFDFSALAGWDFPIITWVDNKVR